MSTFEESPLTGPLPPGSLPAKAPLVPSQPSAPGQTAAGQTDPVPPLPAAAPGAGVPLAEPGQPVPAVDAGVDAGVGAGLAGGSPVVTPDPVALVPPALDPVALVPEPADPDLPTTDLPTTDLPTTDLPTTGPVAAGRPRRMVAGLLAGVLLVGALLAGALAYERHVQAQDRAVDAARDQAVAVVRLAAPLLLSYDYRTLSTDFAAALAYTDGDFRKQYQQTTTTVVSPVAVQYKAVVRAQLIEVGVTSATADRVVVVAFVNQVTTSTRVTGTKLDQSRVRFELRRTEAAWKIVLVAAL